MVWFAPAKPEIYPPELRARRDLGECRPRSDSDVRGVDAETVVPVTIDAHKLGCRNLAEQPIRVAAFGLAARASPTPRHGGAALAGRRAVSS
jgi:hypothetical protein